MDRTRIRSVKWWQFHHALWRYKLLVIAVVILGTAISAIYTSRIPKQYRSASSAMIDTLSAQVVYDYGGGPSSTDFSRAHKVLAESKEVKRDAITATEMDPAIFALSSFEARTDGVLIYFQIIDGDPEAAAALANSWREVFIEQLKHRSRSNLEVILEGYKAQFEEAKKALDESVKKQQEFFRRTQYDPSLFLNDPIHTQVASLDKARTETEETQRVLTQELAALDNPEMDSAKLMLLDYVKGDLGFTDRFQKVREMEAKLQEQKGLFSDPKNPAVESAESNLAQARTLLEESRKRLKGAMEIKLKLVSDELKIKNAAYAAKKAELDQKQTCSIDYKAISSEIDRRKQTLDQLNERLNAIEQQVKYGHINVIEMEAAEISMVPFVPSWRHNISTGFLLSLLLACALVFGLEQIDDTVRTPRDIEQRLDALVLGAVPACGRRNMTREGYFMAKRQPASVAVDAMRGIHIGIEVRRKSAKNSGPLVVNVTSALPQDGKSFITSNLGVLFGGLGRRVLIVDADLRKASISKALQLDNSNGFLDVLSNAQWDRKFVIRCEATGYDLLPAGKHESSISESFNPETMSKVIDQMRHDYDVIIFDTPPVLALPDACVLGQFADVTLLVTRSRHTRLTQIERAAASMYAANVKDLVFVVNGVDAVDAAAENYGAGYNYSYGYGYGYGKGYGYGHDSRTKPPDTQRIQILPRKNVEEKEEDETIA